MTNRNLVTLAAVAAALGVAAYFANGSAKKGAPRLNGEKVLPGFDAGAVASVEFGSGLKLASGSGGWTVSTYHNYPADRSKLADWLLKLAELKVGQVVRGKALDGAKDLVLRDASGKELAKLSLGEKHSKWGHGRYAGYKGETVLLSDSLDSLEGEGKSFIETKIVDTPYISFNGIAENVPEAELGFATGVVAKVTIAGDTNRTVTVGGKVKEGSDRYLKLDKGDWVFIVPSYSVDSLLPKPPPKDEKKDEVATEPVKAETEAEAKAKPEAKAEAPKEEAKEEKAEAKKE